MGKDELAEPMASEKAVTLEIDRLENFIYEIRGRKVMLDADLASVYRVTTARLNQQVGRNQERFSGDVRAFARMRALLGERQEWLSALSSLENELRERVDSHEAAIVSILQPLMYIIDPPALPEPPKRQIGFHVKEACGQYTRRPS
jgi:hypothetical protein